MNLCAPPMPTMFTAMTLISREISRLWFIPVFVNINLVLQTQMAQFIQYLKEEGYRAQTFETGALRYGNANPDSPDFDSLADFICTGDFIELKLPWQLLNFADPSRMEIHDDYYDGNYGVEYIDIDEMYVGIAGAAGPEGTSSLAAEKNPDE